MKLILTVSLMLTAFVLAEPGQAWAADPDVVAQADALAQSGHPQGAYELLAPLADEKAANAEFDYALGIAALDSGKPAEAIVALQRALMIRPDFAQARAEIARAYAMAGDVDTARREFNTVAGNPSIPDPVRRQFFSAVQQLDKINKPGLAVSGYLQAGSGYDSNVNAATSASQLLIPLFASLGPATLSGAAQRQGDGFASGEAGLSLDYGFDRQSHVFASLLGSEHATFENHAFDQTSGNATLGYGYTFASRDVATVSLQGQEFLLGGKDYQRAFGVVGQFTHQLDYGRAISAIGQFYDIRYPTDPLRDSKRYAAGVTFSDKTYFTSILGGYEKTDNVLASYLDNSFIGLRAGWEHPLSSSLRLFANASYEYRDYKAADPLFLVNRSDHLFDLSAGLRWHLIGPAVLIPQVSYTSNQSNIALYHYDRFTGGVSVRAEF